MSKAGRKKFGADLSIIIPTAGIGRRMKSHGAKPLIELSNNETVITHQIKLLKKNYPKAEIIVVVGFQSEKIIKHLSNSHINVKIIENELYEESNVSRSIGLALRIASHTNILIIYGDIIFNSSTLNNLITNNSTIVVDSKNQMNDEEVGVTIVNGYVTRFSYGLTTKWGHIVFLNGKELEIFKNIACDKIKKKLHGFELLNHVLEQGGKIKVIEPKTMRIVEIDSSKDVSIAQYINGK